MGVAGGLVVPRVAWAQVGETSALARVEAYMNELSTLQAQFNQVSSDGGFAEGTLYVSRPGRLRLDYAPPSPVTIIADGTFLVYVDEELGETTHLLLSETPADLLVRKNLSFRDASVIVNHVDVLADGGVAVEVMHANDPDAGRLTMTFSADPFRLRQWRILDAQGIETSVSLFNVRQGVPLDEDLFDVPRPSRNEFR